MAKSKKPTLAPRKPPIDPVAADQFVRAGSAPATTPPSFSEPANPVASEAIDQAASEAIDQAASEPMDQVVDTPVKQEIDDPVVQFTDSSINKEIGRSGDQFFSGVKKRNPIATRKRDQREVVRLTVYLPPEIEERIRVDAAKLRIDRSAYVTLVLTDFYASKPSG